MGTATIYTHAGGHNFLETVTKLLASVIYMVYKHPMHVDVAS